MIEKLIVLEDIDPVIFYGVNNANMQLIKALYPKLRIVARGNVIKVLGDEEEMCAFEENITKLEKYCAEYNSLKEEVIIDIIKGNAPQAEKSGNVIVFSVTGKPIIPRSENQLKLVEGFAKNDMVFAIGPAGSGKTYTAIALAVRALKNKESEALFLLFVSKLNFLCPCFLYQLDNFFVLFLIFCPNCYLTIFLYSAESILSD